MIKRSDLRPFWRNKLWLLKPLVVLVMLSGVGVVEAVLHAIYDARKDIVESYEDMFSALFL